MLRDMFKMKKNRRKTLLTNKIKTEQINKRTNKKNSPDDNMHIGKIA